MGGGEARPLAVIQSLVETVILLLCSQFLDHLRLEFSASLACGGLAAPPAVCSRIGVFCPIPLWGRSSL